MSEDPKGFDAGDYNLYRYVGNDPLDKADPMGLLPPKIVYENIEKKKKAEAQMKALRAIPEFKEKFKVIDANNVRNVVTDAQSESNPALKTPNGAKANMTKDDSQSIFGALPRIFFPSATKTVTSYYDPNNVQTETGRVRKPIFGLANEIGEMFLANGAVRTTGGDVGYDNESIRFENEARKALGAEPRPYNTNSVLQP